jgi:hypothetical protein
MESNSWIGTKAPATQADLAAIERQHGFTLPEDYKTHILRYNGGWPDKATFVQFLPDGERVDRSISDFYSVHQGTNTVEEAILDLDEIHPDLVPFGSEAGGDQFLLSVGPKDYGAVYYLSHEFYTPPEYDYDEDTDESTPPAPLDYGSGVHFLAPSFTAFLNGLVDGPPL